MNDCFSMIFNPINLQIISNEFQYQKNDDDMILFVVVVVATGFILFYFYFPGFNDHTIDLCNGIGGVCVCVFVNDNFSRAQ